MKRFFVLGLVLLILLFGLGPFPSKNNAVAQTVIAYDFLANASSAEWNKWTSLYEFPITFNKVDDTSFDAAYGMAALITTGVKLEDGVKHSPALWIITPIDTAATGTGITGYYRDINIPAHASLHITFGFSYGDTGLKKGMFVGVALWEIESGKPALKLIQETKDYDTTLRDVTFDLSPWEGKMVGF